jgi:hypothetical protein
MPLVVNGPPASAALLARIEGAHIHLSGIAALRLAFDDTPANTC